MVCHRLDWLTVFVYASVVNYSIHIVDERHYLSTRCARRCSQSTINRRRKLSLCAAPKHLQLYDFIKQRNSRPPTSTSGVNLRLGTVLVSVNVPSLFDLEPNCFLPVCVSVWVCSTVSYVVWCAVVFHCVINTVCLHLSTRDSDVIFYLFWNKHCVTFSVILLVCVTYNSMSSMLQ